MMDHRFLQGEVEEGCDQGGNGDRQHDFSERLRAQPSGYHGGTHKGEHRGDVHGDRGAARPLPPGTGPPERRGRAQPLLVRDQLRVTVVEREPTEVHRPGSCQVGQRFFVSTSVRPEHVKDHSGDVCGDRIG